MEIPNLFGWAALLVVGMLIKSVSGMRYGWMFIAGAMLLLSVVTLGYGYGVAAGREAAGGLIGALEKGCTAEFDQAAKAMVIPVAGCREAQARTRLAVIKVGMDTRIGAAAVLTFVACLIYLAHQFELLLASRKRAVVAPPELTNRQQDQHPAERNGEHD